MSQPQRHYTLDDYFAVEEMSVVKHEFFEGEIFAMAGTSLEHNLICSNVRAFLHTALRDTGCAAFDAYRQIPSLREVLLVEQTKVSVEAWRRQDEASWASSILTDLSATLALTAVPLELPLREIYREIFA